MLIPTVYFTFHDSPTNIASVNLVISYNKFFSPLF